MATLLSRDGGASFFIVRLVMKPKQAPDENGAPHA
jgi:hypothetical protein